MHKKIYDPIKKVEIPLKCLKSFAKKFYYYIIALFIE